MLTKSFSDQMDFLFTIIHNGIVVVASYIFDKVIEPSYDEDESVAKVTFKSRNHLDIDDEKSSLLHQLKLAKALADSEALFRFIAEETVSVLEKEKTLKELEHRDFIAKHHNDIILMETQLKTSRDTENELNRTIAIKVSKIDELMIINKKLQEDLAKSLSEQQEAQKLKVMLRNETMLKQVAVDKLLEIMDRRV